MFDRRILASLGFARTHFNNTTWGAHQISAYKVAKAACVTQTSRIAIDELAYLILLTSVETENTRR